MKYLKSFFISILLLTSSVFAIGFEKGANVPDIHPRLLRSYILKGVDTHEGHKIVYDEKAEVPAKIQKKWQERKLSGESVPLPGTKGPDVIFITKFK